VVAPLTLSVKSTTHKDFERNFKTRILHRAKDAAPSEETAEAENLKKRAGPFVSAFGAEKSRQDARATKSNSRSLVAEKLSSLGVTTF